MVDCILAYAATVLVDKMTDPKSAEGREMLDLVKADARASKQILLLAHLCASSLQIDMHECMVLYWCHLTGGSLAYLTCPSRSWKWIKTMHSSVMKASLSAMQVCKDRRCKPCFPQARAAEATVQCY
jgi:hypothetical protein